MSFYGDVNTSFRTSYVQSDALGQPTSCYATLAGYNAHVPGTVNAPMAIKARPSQLIQGVPVWGSGGYDVLTHNVPRHCGGYFTIEGAYPDYSKRCGRMVKRACAGVIRK